jgi:hypothetical protein
MAAADLAELLEDELDTLRQTLGEGAFPKDAACYLNDRAGPENGWLTQRLAFCIPPAPLVNG